MGEANHERKGTPGGLRRGLMLYGSTAALAAALMLAEGGLAPAWAQDIGPRISPTEAAQGNFVVPGASPSPYFEYRSGELDIVRMNRDAVLNWTTYDTAAPGGAQGNSYVNFLPEGAELRFTGGGQSFTAINRVLTQPDNGGAYRGIAFQGQVTSYLFSDGPNSVGPVGGNIWFYSPGGILATGTSSFNVGSLLLSASDLDGFTEFGGARDIDLVGVTDPFASVILQTGARVTLTEPNSSFAIVAPTIVQAGDVTVDGSVLYMSAETGYLYFYNNGQISGAIYQEAQAGNEVRHLGTTTGPASLNTDNFSVYDPQTIEFRTGADVGVLLSGSVGYAPATDAALGPNGSIVLYAGAVSSGDLSLSSNTFIESARVDLSVGAGESLTMGGDANGAYGLDVVARDATLGAGAGGTIDIDGNVSFRAPYETGSFRVSAADAQGNLAGGRIDVGGDLLLNSSLSNFSGASIVGGEIEVTIGDGGGIAVGGSMTLLSDGYASEDGNEETFAGGGRAVVTMTGLNASLSVGAALTISAQALPFSYNCECSPPPSGSALGGYAALTATGGTIEIDTLNVSAGAEAFGGGYTYESADLTATGGTALVSLGDSTASIGNASITANATGASASTGVEGGAATGGTASFAKGSNGSLLLGGLYVAAEAEGGEGSNSYEGGDPGRGGDATGGTASVSLGQTPRGLGYFEVSAEASGGSGGSAVNASGVSGAAGGDATGGTVSLILTGEGTVLTGVSEGQLQASASGGEGGNGEEDYNELVQSGAGGSGGFGQAGSVTVTAAGGAEYASELTLGVSGSGGAGGTGGDAVFGEGSDAEPGEGGQGGDGFGGEAALIADGGTISGSLEIEAYGNGGQGGLNGYIGENYPGQGDYGSFVGGSITLTATDNGTSRFDLESATLRTSGDTTGTIAIVDETTGPGAGMRFGSLLAQAGGAPVEEAPTIRVSSVANAIRVDGTAELYGDSIGLTFSGSGGLDVGGFTLMSTNGGDITISHVGNEGNLSLHSGGPIEMYAQGNIVSEPGSVIASADYGNFRATGSITADDVRSLGDLSFAAEGDVTLNNASAGNNFDLYAGRLDLDGSFAYVPSATATITGTVTVRGSALIESGGFAVFAGGSQILSDNAITVRTGDDIVVASGASLVSDIDPYEDETIRLLAGDINFGPNEGDLVEPIGTPIASLLIDGSLDSNGQSIFLSGDAIQAGGTITTGNLTVDVTDAPPFGPYSNDAGLLTNDCRQGSACLGSVTASGDVAIGLDSNGGLVSLTMGAVDFVGGAFDVLAREAIEIGTSETGSLLAGDTRVSLESLEGTVSLTEVTVDSSDIAIRAGGSIDAGSSTLQSPNDILLQVGSDITVGTINTGGRLDDGTGSPTFVVPGNFTVQSLSYGDGNDIRINAGGAIAVTFADPGAADIEMFAGNDLYLGSTGLSTGAIRLDGANVSFNNLVGDGVVYLTASGDISGVSVFNPVIETTSGIALEAGGTISVLNLEAGTDIAVSGATVSTGLLSAGGAIGVEAQGTLIVNGFNSGGYAVFSGASVDLGGGSAGDFLAIQAVEGDITFGSLDAATSGVLQASGALLGGDISVGGALSLQGGSMAIGNAEGGAGIAATIGGDASFVSLTSSNGSITLDVGRAIMGDLVDAAIDVGITGGLVGVDEVTAGGDLLIDSFNIGATTLSSGGDMTLALEGGAFIGEAVAGGDLSLSAGNGITADLLDAGGELFVTSDTPAAIGEAIAGTDLTINASILQTTSLVAGQSIEVNAGAGATIEEAVAGGSFAFTGSELTAGSLDAGTTLDVAVSLLATIDDFTSGGDATLSGRSLDLGSGNVGGSVSAQASEGDLSFGDLEAAASGMLAASGALSGGDIVTGGALSLQGASMAIGSAEGGGGVTAAIGGDVGFTALTSASGPITVTAEGDVAGGLIDAATDVGISGDSIGVATIAAGANLLVSAGSLEATTLSAGNHMTLGLEGSATIGTASATGDLSLSAIGGATADLLTAGDALSVVSEGPVGIGEAVAGSELAIGAGSLEATRLIAGELIEIDAAAGATIDEAIAGSSFSFTGSGLTAGSLEAGTELHVTVLGLAAIDSFSSGGDATIAGQSLVLPEGSVGGALDADANSSLSFSSLDAAGDVALRASTTIAGGDVASGGQLRLDAMTLALGTASGTAGVSALAGGNASFTQLASSAGGVDLVAGGAIEGDTITAASNASIGGGSLSIGSVTAGNDIALNLGALSSGEFTAGGSFRAQVTGGAAQFSRASAGLDAIVSAQSVDAGQLTAGRDIDVTAPGAVTLDSFTAGRNAFIRGSGLTLGTGAIGGDLSAEASTGVLAFDSLSAAGDAALSANGALSGGDITAGQTLTLTGASMAIGDAAGAAGLTADVTGDALFTTFASSLGAVSLAAGGAVAGGSIDAATDASVSGGAVALDGTAAGDALTLSADSLVAGLLTAGGDLSADVANSADFAGASAGGAMTLAVGGDLTVGALTAGSMLDASVGGAAGLGSATVGTGLSIDATTLTAGTLTAGGLLDVIAETTAVIAAFESGGDTNISAGEIDLGTGSVAGDLTAQSQEGALGFLSLEVEGNAELAAAGGIGGGDIAAGGLLTLGAADLTLGDASGAAGVTAQAAGHAEFASLASSGGAISVDAGGAIAGGSAEAAGAVTLAGASVALDNAGFGEGLSLTARSGDLTGAGLYQGTGAVSLQAAQGIAIGSVDALGGITMTAGTEARFVEVRSRDSSVAIDAGGAITGSSVAAAGGNSEGGNDVTLIAGGAIALDGGANSLNTGSRAQDDFIAEAGGTLTIVGASAGRDLALTAGSGTLSAAEVSSGRDLSLTGPAVQLADGGVARNLSVQATAGNITGGGTTTAGGTVELDASGNIAIGSLSAQGGDLTATAGGSIGFTDLYASSAISLTAGGAINGSALDATNGVTASGTSLTLGDVAAGEGYAFLEASEGALIANSVSGASVETRAAGLLSLGAVDANGTALLSGTSIDFDSITAGGSVFMNSSADIEGGAVSAGGFASIFAEDAITLTGLSADEAFVASDDGAVSASGIAVSGLLGARGTALTLSGTGALEVVAEATAGNIGITTSGTLTVDAEATGDIALASTGGSVIITSVSQGEGSFGGIGVESVAGGGAVSVSAANGITVLDSLTAGGALTMTAGGLVTLNGSASGQTIALQAGDLAIGSGALLGGANTQRISLSSRSPVNLGAGASSGFAVDAGEFGRIRSTGDLMITALAGEGGGAGSLTVGSLTVNAGSGGQIGASGTFGLTAGGGGSQIGTLGAVEPTAGGVLDVNSTLAIAGGGASTTLALTGDVVDLDYANAQLSVLDSANAPTGRIRVNGRLITSLSAAAAADIANKSPAEIDTRLGQGDTVREIGLFRTSNLTLEGRDAILIQNSGGVAADERRGVNVGALTVSGAQNGSTLVVINGIVAGETGNNAAENVIVNGTLAANSTVNGCALANVAACFVVAQPEPPLILAPVSVLFGTGDFIKEEVEDDEVEDGVADGKTDAPPIDTTKIDDPAGLPMIDDPVTGAGNEDLWQQPDE